MTEKIVGLDNPELNQETNDIWDRIAGPWDEDFGPDGNQHNAYITDPVTDRLLDLKQGETVLDIACGAGRYARRNIESDHSTGTSRHTITSWDYLDATPIWDSAFEIKLKNNISPNVQSECC
jgi:SAM-dependent methyltransferase